MGNSSQSQFDSYERVDERVQMSGFAPGMRLSEEESSSGGKCAKEDKRFLLKRLEVGLDP